MIKSEPFVAILTFYKKSEPRIVREAIRDSKSDRLLCRCPFHKERTPSFTLIPETGEYSCLSGCGSGYLEERDTRYVVDSLGVFSDPKKYELVFLRKKPTNPL